MQNIITPRQGIVLDETMIPLHGMTIQQREDGLTAKISLDFYLLILLIYIFLLLRRGIFMCQALSVNILMLVLERQQVVIFKLKSIKEATNEKF